MRSSLIDSNRSTRRKTAYNNAIPPATHPDTLSRPAPEVPGPAAVRVRAHRSLVPREGWLPLFLLAIALYCVVYSIVAANWVDNATLLFWSPVPGLWMGFLAARILRLPQLFLHLVACLLGQCFAVWFTCSIAFHLPWPQLLQAVHIALSGQAAGGNIQTSEIVFFFYLTFLCFFLGYFGSWLIYRAHLPWLVALIYCSILLVNLNYVDHDLLPAVIIMFGALILLIARMYLVTQIVTWSEEGLHTDRAWLRTMNRRRMQVACLIMLVAVLVGWILPMQGQPTSGRVFWDRLNNAWSNIVSGHVSWQDLGSLTSPYQPKTNFFSDRLTVSGSVQLPQGEVLRYKSSDGQAHYLEGFSYNYFDGHTWSSTVRAGTYYAAGLSYPADDPSAGYNEIVTAVTVIQPPEGNKHYLFAPALPIKFDVNTIIYNDGTTASWTKQTALTYNETYNVDSQLPDTDPNNLSLLPLPQNDATPWQIDSYFERLQEGYLSIPTDLSPAVAATVKQWTHGARNAYDALSLIEAHLNNEHDFHYSLDNAPIPANMDVVDWLLKNRTGYCTHYATAMAVMGRLLGIPTRVINGFSQGHYDTSHAYWSVNGTDAHSWVQAYFPGYGWINFDPTPGFALNGARTENTVPTPVATPSPAPVVATPSPAATHPQPTVVPTRPVRTGAQTKQSVAALADPVFLTIMALALLAVSLLFLFWACMWYRRRQMYANSTAVASMYWRICRMASWIGMAPQRWQTPYEYSQALDRRLQGHAIPFTYLTELFVRNRWGTNRGQPSEQEEVAVQHLWPSLRQMLFRLWLRKFSRSS